MRTISVLAVASVAALASASPLTKSTAQGQYDHLAKAFLQKDLKTFEAFLAPNYVLVRAPGKNATRVEVIRDFEQMSKVMSFSSWSRSVTDINGSVVSVKGTFKATIKDPQGKPHSLTMDAMSTDTWVQNKGRWQIVKSVVGKQKATLDGKPIQMH